MLTKKANDENYKRGPFPASSKMFLELFPIKPFTWEHMTILCFLL